MAVWPPPKLQERNSNPPIIYNMHIPSPLLTKDPPGHVCITDPPPPIFLENTPRHFFI